MRLINMLNAAEALRELQSQQQILDRFRLGLTPDRIGRFQDIIGAEQRAANMILHRTVSGHGS